MPTDALREAQSKLLGLRVETIGLLAEADGRIGFDNEDPIKNAQKTLSLHVSRAMLAGERVGLTRALDVLSEAEARLIAAAPELLEACKGLLTCSLPIDASGKAMVDHAVAAIAKATSPTT